MLRLVSLLLPLALAHCSSVRFYTQAAAGQWEIQRKARPIKHVLADPATPAPLQKKLNLVQEIRAYARHSLNLPADRQYHRYTDLQRKHLVWVVFAAPEFSLEPHTWRYPFLGKLSYQGWFNQKNAAALGDRLRSRGLDVFIAEVNAYSTLGVFSDPVLNTFIHLPPRDLAELLFHELTHQRLYLPGDTDFNEALATAVARHATRRWLAHSQQFSQLAAYDRESLILSGFIAEIDRTRAALQKTYARPGLSPEALRAAKSAAFAGLRLRCARLNQRHGGTLKIDRWFDLPLNNARLNSVSTYYHLVPAFERLLAEHCQNDLESLFALLKTTRRMSPARRLAWLESRLTSPSPAPHLQTRSPAPGTATAAPPPG